MKNDLLDTNVDNEVEINLSPMIDCIFILLIFFIVTAVFVQEPGIEVNRPQASGSETLSPNSILIAISNEGRIYYGGKEINLSKVRPLIHRVLSIDELPVIIQTDENASHGIFAKVYGEAKSAGAENIHFATKQSQ